MKHSPEPNPIWAALLRPWVLGPVAAALLFVASLVISPAWPSRVGKVFSTIGSSSVESTRSPVRAEEDLSGKGFYIGVSPDRERPFDSRGDSSPFSGKYAPIGTATDDEGVTDEAGATAGQGASGDATSTADAGTTEDTTGSAAPGDVELSGQSLTVADENDAAPNLLDVSQASTSGVSIGVYSSGPFEAHDAKNMALIVDIPPGTKARVYYKGAVYTLKAGDRTFALSEPVRFIPREGAVLEFSDHKDKSVSANLRYNAFLGDLSVRYSKASNALWAVNELPVEDYLKGMAEADEKGAMEYLKTMAVVARSYAMFYLVAGGKHKGEPFDLHNSRLGNGNDQVYIGYNLGKRFKRIPQGIDATKGRVITYQGNVAKAPYFAGTDGKTRSAVAVFGPNSNLPFCKSVSDPYGVISNPKTMPGNHMVGLSGKGARGYAKAGKDHEFILKHYYTGIGLDTMTPSRNIRVGIYKVKL